MFFYSKEAQVGKFQDEKLVNVWRPHLKSLPFNYYMSQNKFFYKKPSNLKNFLAQISNLNVETLQQLEKLFSIDFFKINIEILNNLKNSLTHTLKS